MITILPLIPSSAGWVSMILADAQAPRERGGEVRGDHLVEVAGRERGQRRAAINAGHVDQSIEAAEAVDDLLNRVFGLAGSCQIGGDGQSAAHRGLDLGDRLLDRRAAGVKGHGDVRAASRQHESQLAADAPASGDQHDLPGELAIGRTCVRHRHFRCLSR